MQTIIAEERFCYTARDGSMRSTKIYLRAPYQLADAEWGCYCHVEELLEKEVRTHGDNSIQALCLAIAFVKLLLQRFEEQGVLFYYPEDTSAPVEAAYLFGDNMSLFQKDGVGLE